MSGYGQTGITTTPPSSNKNTFIGYQAGKTNIGNENTAIGAFAGEKLSSDPGTPNSGAMNTFVGYKAGSGGPPVTPPVPPPVTPPVPPPVTPPVPPPVTPPVTPADNTGGQNTFIGSSAGELTESGNVNTFLGHETGRSNTTTMPIPLWEMMQEVVMFQGANNTFVGGYTGRKITPLWRKKYLHRRSSGS